MTSDLVNLSNNGHSHGDHLCQVSLKSFHQVKRHRIMRNRCKRTDGQCMDGWQTQKHKPFATYC